MRKSVHPPVFLRILFIVSFSEILHNNAYPELKELIRIDFPKKGYNLY